MKDPIIKIVLYLNVTVFSAFAAFDSIKVPYLSIATSNVISVATTNELIEAVASAFPGQTILINDGVYDLKSTLRLRQSDLTLRGASVSPEKVVLKGQGFGTGNINEELVTVENSNITIAYLTISDVRANGLKIQNSSASNLVVHNVYFIDICERSIKSPQLEVPAKNGVIRYCYFGQITPITSSIPNLNSNGDYIAGMDMMFIDGWKIHDNLFKNIRGMNGGGRAAIFLWNTVTNCIVERNTIVNCDRGIGIGNASNMTKPGEHVKSVIIRNNFISSDKYDAAIEVAGADSISIVNNSIFKVNLSGSRGVRFINYHTNISFQNNILHGRIIFDNGESGVANKTNLIGDYRNYFKNPLDGDLHLTSLASSALAKGDMLSIVTDDYDLQSRTVTSDIGADQVPSTKTKKNEEKYMKKSANDKDSHFIYMLSGKKIGSKNVTSNLLLNAKVNSAGGILLVGTLKK